MKKIIVLVLITSFAATGAAMARGAGGPNGPGGNGGPGADRGGDGPAPVIVRLTRRPTYQPRAPKKVDFCHIGGVVAASDMECGHYSR